MSKLAVARCAIAAALYAVPCSAQSMMDTDNSPRMSFDWNAIQKCAAGDAIDLSSEPPPPQVGDNDFVAKYDRWHKWEIEQTGRMRSTEFCHIAIAARHAGYLAGQKTPQAPDAFAPIQDKARGTK